MVKILQFTSYLLTYYLRSVSSYLVKYYHIKIAFCVNEKEEKKKVGVFGDHCYLFPACCSVRPLRCSLRTGTQACPTRSGTTRRRRGIERQERPVTSFLHRTSSISTSANRVLFLRRPGSPN